MTIHSSSIMHATVAARRAGVAYGDIAAVVHAGRLEKQNTGDIAAAVRALAIKAPPDAGGDDRPCDRKPSPADPQNRKPDGAPPKKSKKAKRAKAKRARAMSSAELAATSRRLDVLEQDGRDRHHAARIASLEGIDPGLVAQAFHWVGCASPFGAERALRRAQAKSGAVEVARDLNERELEYLRACIAMPIGGSK